jgi:ParB family chromosome partitioning protein
MLVPTDSIIVKKRIRKDLGDITGLMHSLKNYGQLTPIIINRDYELIAGFRRLQAAKRLGWRSIEALMVDKPSEPQKLEIEIEENIQRKQLSSEEIADGMARIQKLRHPSLLTRIWNFLLRLFRAIFGRKRKKGKKG